MIISEQEKKRIIRLHEATSTDSSGSYETPLFREPQAEEIFDFMSQPDVVGGDNLVNDEDVVVIDLTDETDTEDFLSDIFDMSEEDDEERMRVLHKENSIVKEDVNQMGSGSGFIGTQGGSDRLNKFTKRQDIGEGEDVDSELYEGMDATNIDLDSQDLEKVVETEEESYWLQEDWDDLSEDVQNAYKEHKEFSGMEESAIREKFNAMPLEALCKISRFMLGWIVKLFRAPVSAFNKSLRKTSPMVGPKYGRRRAWRCKKRYRKW